MKNKYVYFFGNNHAEGKASMTNLLGGKGANLAEMVNLKIPVPPGYTITTEACVYYMKHGQLPPGCKMQIKQALKKIETILNLFIHFMNIVIKVKLLKNLKMEMKI